VDRLRWSVVSDLRNHRIDAYFGDRIAVADFCQGRGLATSRYVTFLYIL